MRRLETAPAATVPPRLLHFEAADWPAPSDLGAYLEWKCAREMHREAHGWPTDGLEFLRELLAERRRHESERLAGGYS